MELLWHFWEISYKSIIAKDRIQKAAAHKTAAQLTKTGRLPYGLRRKAGKRSKTSFRLFLNAWNDRTIILRLRGILYSSHFIFKTLASFCHTVQSAVCLKLLFSRITFCAIYHKCSQIKYGTPNRFKIRVIILTHKPIIAF